MNRSTKRKFQKSFEKTLMDRPLTRKRIVRDKKYVTVPLPLQPTPYVPDSVPSKPKPIPKPRIISKRASRRYPVPAPRPVRPLPRKINQRVQRLIREITPLYKPEAIEKFKKSLAKEKNFKVAVKEIQRALKRNAKSFSVDIISDRDPLRQTYFSHDAVREALDSVLESDRGLKAFLTLQITFKKQKIVDGQEVFEFKNAYFNSKAFTIINSEEISNALDQAAEEIMNGIAKWISEGSGWTIEAILSHYLNVVKYVPLRGNSYLPLPKELQHHKKRFN